MKIYDDGSRRNGPHKMDLNVETIKVEAELNADHLKEYPIKVHKPGVKCLQNKRKKQ
jgi:hypothetical protein